MSTYPDPPCPFCAIASKYSPIPPSSPETTTTGTSPIPSPNTTQEPDDQNQPQTHLILSTKHVLAFLDIMPLTRGHVLVVTREHYGKLGEVGVQVGMELGKWLPIISRVVTRTVLGNNNNGNDIDAHWNVVQNNGTRAAQVVPHVHFHVIPRPPLHGSTPGSGSRTTPDSGSTRAKTRASFTIFGRGQRDDLDDNEGRELARAMRVEMGREVRRVWEEKGVNLDVDADVNADDSVCRKGKL